MNLGDTTLRSPVTLAESTPHFLFRDVKVSPVDGRLLSATILRPVVFNSLPLSLQNEIFPYSFFFFRISRNEITFLKENKLNLFYYNIYITKFTQIRDILNYFYLYFYKQGKTHFSNYTRFIFKNLVVVVVICSIKNCVNIKKKKLKEMS